jgi:tripartite-type tricarboxylate transporter receptor subunit TctC
MRATRSRYAVFASTVFLAGALVSFASGEAQSQSWPNRFVRLIVPLASGGLTDFVARLIAEPLSKAWGQQVVIENKPGAGGNFAAETVARSEPDGYTILFSSSSIAVNQNIYRAAGYDPIADFAPVAQLTRFPFFMFVPNSLPATTVKEFIAVAKASKTKLTLASPGTGSTPHLTGELFARMAGLEMTHVPYRGASPMLNDLIPGRVDLYFASGSLLENARAGQIRVLAVTSSEREPAAPELPTVAEAALPGFEASSWHALFMPAKTPREIVRKTNADALGALSNPVVAAKLAQLGYRVAGSTPEGLAELLKTEIDKWSAVIRQAGIKAD